MVPVRGLSGHCFLSNSMISFHFLKVLPMKNKPKTPLVLTPTRNAPHHNKLLRAIEADLLKAGATAQEVTQLRQCAGDHLSAALAIALMKTRQDGERSRFGL